MRRAPDPPVHLAPGLDGQLGQGEVRLGDELAVLGRATSMLEMSRRHEGRGLLTVAIARLEQLDPRFEPAPVVVDVREVPSGRRRDRWSPEPSTRRRRSTTPATPRSGASSPDAPRGGGIRRQPGTRCRRPSSGDGLRLRHHRPVVPPERAVCRLVGDVGYRPTSRRRARGSGRAQLEPCRSAGVQAELIAARTVRSSASGTTPGPCPPRPSGGRRLRTPGHP